MRFKELLIPSGQNFINLMTWCLYWLGCQYSLSCVCFWIRNCITCIVFGGDKCLFRNFSRLWRCKDKAWYSSMTSLPIAFKSFYVHRTRIELQLLSTCLLREKLRSSTVTFGFRLLVFFLEKLYIQIVRIANAIVRPYASAHANLHLKICITKMPGEGTTRPAQPRKKAVRLTAVTFEFPYVERAFP